MTNVSPVPARRWRPGRRLLVIGLIALPLLPVLLAFAVLRGSLPQLEGQAATDGLSGTVTVERDELGVPTLVATTRPDLAHATGYVHAQDRFFQMDLQRRLAAGELAELLGEAAVDTDLVVRRHQFRRVAGQVLEQLSVADRALLEAYAAGVNAALHAFTARPWEYWLLGGATPVAWRAEDSLLVAFAMYLDLNDSGGERELSSAALKASLPSELYSVLHPLGSEWDAPVDGGTWRVPPLPQPQVFNLRDGAARVAALAMPPRRPFTGIVGDAALGSNSWAVAGTHTATGGALLANDMHLGLQVPNIWYRLRLRVTGGNPLDIVGVSLPGLPLVIAGSNGSVAWGFTNSHGDWTDLVTLRIDPATPDRYQTSAGAVPFDLDSEEIRVRGAPPRRLEIRRTVWGPVVAQDAAGTPLALSWTAQRPEATNLAMRGLETARTVEEALDVANRSGAPVQNFVAVDRAGSIGWTLFGRIPVRQGYDSRFPSDWSRPESGWTRWRDPEEYPRIVNPLAGRLWTANTRTVDAQAWFDFAGPGGHVLGARAGQIRDGLLALRSATADDMLQIQLDDRALFLARWRDLLLDLLTDAAIRQSDDRRVARELVGDWSARASVDDPGYRIVRDFRRSVLTATFDALAAPARARHPDLEFEPGQQFEATAWQLVTAKPLHLLDPRHDSWDAALLSWLDVALADLRSQCGDLASCSWGQANVLTMRHPLSRALPWFSRWLDMPAVPLPGDANMPRVQGRRQGASERFVVSPGRESEGYFQMPGGQSAHPLSPYFRAGHDAWTTGAPQPLLPGPRRHLLTLVPELPR